MNQMIEERNFEIEANKTLAPLGIVQFVARIGYLTNLPKSYSVRISVSKFAEFNK